MKLSLPTRPHIRLAAALILGTTYLVSGLDADQAEPPAPLKIAIACSPKQLLDFQKQQEKQGPACRPCPL